MGNIITFILKVLEPLLKNCIFTMRMGLAKGLKRRYGFGFKPKFSITEEDKFLMSLDLKGKTVFDVGGYVGLHTMFFARAVGETGKIITFEPNPRNCEELLYNVRLNNLDNVTIMQIGLGRMHEKVDLAIDPIYPARGTVDKNKREQMLRKRGARTVKVEVAPLDSLMEIRKLPRPDFVKVDVEGFEMDVLYSMAKTISNYKPNLFIEIHGEILREMMEFLISKKYFIYHIESNTKITSYNLPVIKGGHLFCK